jgi:hypothetical protein
MAPLLASGWEATNTSHQRKAFAAPPASQTGPLIPVELSTVLSMSSEWCTKYVQSSNKIAKAETLCI